MKILAGVDKYGKPFMHDVSKFDRFKITYKNIFNEQLIKFKLVEFGKENVSEEDIMQKENEDCYTYNLRKEKYDKYKKLILFLDKMMNAESEDKFLKMAKKVEDHIGLCINIVNNI